MKTAKVTNIVRIFSLDCPHCGGDVANDSSGSLDFYDNDSNGQTGTCTVCNATVRLPAALRSNR